MVERLGEMRKERREERGSRKGSERDRERDKRQFEEKEGLRDPPLLPARASEQGNVIGLVSVYIYVVKKNCN